MLLMNPPYTLVRPDHYVVTEYMAKGERVAFGMFLPLSKKAATQYLNKVKHSGSFRVIMRKTAHAKGLI